MAVSGKSKYCGAAGFQIYPAIHLPRSNVLAGTRLRPAGVRACRRAWQNACSGRVAYGRGRDEHERTMAFAEIALGQIKALRQSASPRNYEIWYAYATGYNPSLNQIINETLAAHGTLTEADLEQIYDDLFLADPPERPPSTRSAAR